MCECAWDENGKLRWQRVLANGSLVVGLVLWLFVHPAGRAARDWLDGVVGLMMGFSVAANLMLVWKGRRGARQAEL